MFANEVGITSSEDHGQLTPVTLPNTPNSKLKERKNASPKDFNEINIYLPKDYNDTDGFHNIQKAIGYSIIKGKHNTDLKEEEIANAGVDDVVCSMPTAREPNWASSTFYDWSSWKWHRFYCVISNHKMHIQFKG